MRDPVTFEEEKPKHPLSRANWLSVATFWYANKTLFKGIKRPMIDGDLSDPLPSHRANYLGHKIAKKWTEELILAQNKKREPKLMNVLSKCFCGKLLWLGVLIGLSELLRLMMPIFVSLTIKYFRGSQSATKYDTFWNVNGIWTSEEPITRTQVYLFGSLTVLLNLVPILIFHPILFECAQIGMCMRIGCCSLIYRKALRVNTKAIDGRITSSTVNLLIQDLSKFDLYPLLIHYLWIGPLQIVIITIIFCDALGAVTAFLIMMPFMLIVPVNLILAIIVAKFRKKSFLKREQRLRQMYEIVTGITLIKMCNWEKVFMESVGDTRKKEMSALRYQNYAIGFFMALIMFVSRGGIFLGSLLNFLESNTISAELIFFILTYFQILRQTVTVYFPTALTQLIEANMAAKTLDNFLNLEEAMCGDTEPLHPQDDTSESQFKYHYNFDNMQYRKCRVILRNVSYKFNGRIVLKEISFTALPGSLTIIVGPSGCGKSTLLKLILNEFPPLEGTVHTIGFVSYASEYVWLFLASIRQNILFGLPYSGERYRRVIDVCSLARDLSHLRKGDRTITGEEGVPLSSGQKSRIHLARAVYKDADIYLLDDPFTNLDERIGRYVYENCVCDFLKDKIVIMTTHSLEYLEKADQIIMMEEGQIYAIGTLDELQAIIRNSNRLNDMQNYINQNVSLKERKSRFIISRSDVAFDPVVTQELSRINDFIEKKLSKWIYWVYFRYIGSYFLLIMLCLLFVLSQALVSGCDYFLSMWIRMQNPDRTDDSIGIDRKTCMDIYSALIAMVILASLTRSILFFQYCKVASVKFHNAMLKSVIHTNLQFFYDNSSEKILNRFCKDIAVIDEVLPSAIIESFQFLLALIGVGFILTIITPYMLIPTTVCSCLLYLLRMIYVKTSGHIASLESRLKAPLYTHMHATLLGLTTIRSHGGETLLVAEFDKYQDRHTGVWFLKIMTDCAFGYWIDLICVILISSVILTLIMLSNFLMFDKESVGLVITQCLGVFGILQYGVKQSAVLANNIKSVENVIEYVLLKKERANDRENVEDPPENWPEHGIIEFRHVNVKYDVYYEPVLIDINFKIDTREKIGIVGRTGSGKTSLILSLFQLVNVEGTIFIDGIDISTLNYEKFRNKISVIPQEPILFCGTLRHNLDPFEHFTNKEIYKALLLIEYKSAFTNGMRCLNDNITEGGGNLSNGEKQLLCLARVILNKNRIIILDEATSNIDPFADQFVQSILTEKFNDCTIITIAHRLNIIMSYDKILLLDEGKIMEYDHPFILLKKKNGAFASMIEDSGNAINLKRIAEMVVLYQQLQ